MVHRVECSRQIQQRHTGTYQPIVRFQRNFVQESKIACRQSPSDKNCQFRKMKMADGLQFEKRYIAVSQLRLLMKRVKTANINGKNLTV